MTEPVHTSELIRSHREALSPAERRVADVVIADPQMVAFGTVAELAARADTSGASVVRLSTRLGLQGFSELQERVRDELTHQIHQAARRIHLPSTDDLLSRTAANAAEAVQGSLGAIRREDFDAAVEVLADPARHVFVLASDASRGIGGQFRTELSMVRRDVTQVEGSPVAVHRTLAEIRPDDVLIALDLARYDKWVLDAAGAAVSRGAVLLSVTDSLLSPLSVGATLVFVIGADSAGPFDSHVVALAVFEALVAGVAAVAQASAAEHLEQIESAWMDAEVLRDD